MSTVWKPEKDPPCLDKYCHLSHDAQRVMLALYSDYLQCRSDVMETKRVASNSKGYYQSMYEAKFGEKNEHTVNNIQAHSKVNPYGFTPATDTGNDSDDTSGVPVTPPRRNTSNTASRRLDFSNQTTRSVNSSYIQKDNTQQLPVNAFNRMNKLIDNRKLSLVQHTRSPESSTYSDSPPIETHDFRILSQFQRDNDTQDDMESLTEEGQTITIRNDRDTSSLCQDNSVIYIDNITCDGNTVIQPNIKDTEANVNFVENNINNSLEREGKNSSPEKELSGSQSLFSQDVSDSRYRSAKKTTERQPVQKHCVTLQKSYLTNCNNAYENKRLKSIKRHGHENSISNINKDTNVDVDMPLEFSKKLVVSPPMNAVEHGTKKVDFTKELEQTAQFNFKPILSTDIGKRSFKTSDIQPVIAGIDENQNDTNHKGPEHAVDATCRNKEKQMKQGDLHQDQLHMEEENPVSFIRNNPDPKPVGEVADLNNNKTNTLGNLDATNDKMYPIFSKQSLAQQRTGYIDSSVQNYTNSIFIKMENFSLILH